MFAQGAFQIDPNITPEEIAARRERIAASRPRYGSARFVGEGLGQLGSGIAEGLTNRRLNKAERSGREGAADLFARLMGGQGSTQAGGPMTVLGVPPEVETQTEGQAIAGDTMQALGLAKGGNQQEFIAAMMPHALRVSQQTGLDPRIVIAQAAQETGWGKHAPNNNYFGIKSHGKPGGSTLSTKEVVGGNTVTVNDSFRGYGGMGESADDYARFLQENPRYRDMLSAGDLDGQLAALGRSGYATDPNYANSVGSIARGIPMQSGSGQPQQPQAPQPSGTLNELYSALQNPWLNQAQRGVVMQMIEDERKKADPMTALGLEKAQLEVEALRNPQAKPTDDQREYEFAQSQGFPGTFQDWLLEQRKAGATSVSTTVNSGDPIDARPIVDKPDKGTQRRWDPEKQTWVDEPIPGSEASVDREKEDRSLTVARSSYDHKYRIVDTKIDEAVRMLDEKGSWVAGFGSVMAGVPESDARTFKGALDTIRANLGFEELQAMRDASPTGGALGQVTEREIAFLQSMSGALDQGQSPEDLKRILMEIQEGRKAFAAERKRIMDGGEASDISGMSDEDYLRSLGLE